MAADSSTLVDPAALLDVQSDSVVASAATLSSTSTAASSLRSSRPSTPTVAVATRSFDGTGNNLANPELGSTNEQLLRVAPAEYADGVSALAGADRLSARYISNLLAAQDEEAAPNDRGLSAFIYIWGQFLDHDIDLTESSTTNPERLPVSVPVADLQFD